MIYEKYDNWITGMITRFLHTITRTWIKNIRSLRKLNVNQKFYKISVGNSSNNLSNFNLDIFENVLSFLERIFKVEVEYQPILIEVYGMKKSTHSRSSLLQKQDKTKA